MRKRIDERRKLILSERERGVTFTELAARLNLSKCRVGQLYASAVKKREYEKTIDSGSSVFLSRRAAASLWRFHIDHISQREAIDRYLNSMKNRKDRKGKETLNEVRKWVGLPELGPVPRKPASKESIEKAVKFLERYGYEVKKQQA